jgi:hypothetical protein
VQRAFLKKNAALKIFFAACTTLICYGAKCFLRLGKQILKAVFFVLQASDNNQITKFILPKDAQLITTLTCA